MLKITGKRQSGKTSALVGMFLQDDSSDAVLVVPNARIATWTRKHWPQLKQRKVISLEKIEYEVRGLNARLYVDEIQMCNGYLPNHIRIIAYTQTV